MPADRLRDAWRQVEAQFGVLDIDLAFGGHALIHAIGLHPSTSGSTYRAPDYVTAAAFREIEVTLVGDFPAWKRALDGLPNATLRLYPELSHELIAGEGPPTPQDYLKQGHVSGRLIRDIAEWITS